MAPRHFGRAMLHMSPSRLSSKAAPPPGFVGEAIDRAVPPDEATFGNLVYVGSISRQIYASKLISFTSSVGGIAIQPVLLREMENLPIFAQIVVESFCGFFVFLTPFLLHFVARRYVLRLYYDPTTNLFTTVSLRFLPRKKFVHFSRDDVSVPPVPGMFTSIVVQQGDKGLPFFINPPEFLDNDAYKILMGYDLPMDILRDPEEDEGKKRRQTG